MIPAQSKIVRLFPASSKRQTEMKLASQLLIALALVLTSQLSPISAQEISWNASGRNGAVAAGHPDSVAAGISILSKGGRAADAAAATILALAVTDYGSFAIGGEVPVIVYDSESQQVKTLSGVGGAPLDPAAIEWFYKNGIPWKGSMKAAPGPGVIDLVVTLLKLHGTISFEQAVTPTLALLDRGKEPWHPDLAVFENLWRQNSQFPELENKNCPQRAIDST
jgi:gamma-glutamyltranspeptidase/glutathione hydrolase